jgi:hypothetical protein
MTVSDGYHTFDELYEHRHALFLCLVNNLFNKANGWITYKSFFHYDGTGYGGYFLCGVKKDSVHLSYHLPESYWDLCHAPSYHQSPIEYDSHSSADTIKHLLTLAENDFEELTVLGDK